MAQELLHATLENEIRALVDELRARQTLETTPGEAKEMIRAALGERIKRADIGAPTDVSANPAPAPSVGAKPSTILPPYAHTLSREQQLRVEQLVDVALHQGFASAVASAKKLDPIILDVLHDTLAGKLYGLMKERNLI
jgi:hypothetical protein